MLYIAITSSIIHSFKSDDNISLAVSQGNNPFRHSLVLNLLVPSSVLLTFLRTNNTNVITNAVVNKFANNTIEAA